MGFGTLQIINSQITNNGSFGLSLGSGERGEYTDVNISNSIITGNRGVGWPNGGQISYDDGTRITLKNCVIEKGASKLYFQNEWNQNYHRIDTSDCITGVPNFVNPTAGAGRSFNASLADWRLKSDCNGTSIGFNSGTDKLADGTILSTSIFTDLDGKPRISCGKVDIGPYELQHYTQGIIASKLIDSSTVCEGDSLSNFLSSAVCTAIGSTYQWQVSNAGGLFTDIIGANASSLSLANIAGNANRNLYRLKINNQACSKISYTDSALLLVKQGPVFTIAADTAICENETINVQGGVNLQNPLWSDGNTNANRTLAGRPSRTLKLTATNINGCKGSDTIKIESKTAPIINLGNDTSLVNSNTLVLQTAGGITQVKIKQEPWAMTPI
jgi:hypothetical protein